MIFFVLNVFHFVVEKLNYKKNDHFRTDFSSTLYQIYGLNDFLFVCFLTRHFLLCLMATTTKQEKSKWSIYSWNEAFTLGTTDAISSGENGQIMVTFGIYIF